MTATIRILFLCLGLAEVLRAEAVPFRLRVCTYNCGSATYLDLSPFGLARIAEEVIDNRADVVGLTEMDLGTAWFGGRDLIAELLVALAARGYPMHVFQTHQVPYQNGWVVHGFLSRWPILEQEDRVLSPDRWWRVERIRIEPVPGLLLDFYQSHYPIPGGYAGRSPYVRQCFAFINESSLPRVYFGDLNFGLGDPLMQIARDAGFRHACVDGAGSPCLSVGPGAALVSPLPLQAQIDHIFVSPQVRVVRAYTHFTSVSDHWPVFAELEFDAPATTPDLGDNARTPYPARPWDEAMDAYRQGDHAGAERLFAQQALRLNEDSDRTYLRYCAGCTALLRSDTQSATGHFRQLVDLEKPGYWRAWARQRLSFLYEQAGQARLAADQLEAFLVEYYDLIHPYAADNTLRYNADRLATLRTASGPATTRADVLAFFCRTHAGRMVAKAAHYLIADGLLGHDDQRWYEHFVQADFDPLLLFNDHRRIQGIALAFARVGDTTRADETVTRRALMPDVQPEHQRNFLGRYWKVRYPEEYDVRLRPGKPLSIPLTGPRHVFRWPGATGELSGTLTLNWQNAALALHVAVIDATHVDDTTGEAIWRGDSLQVAIDPGLEGGGVYDTNDSELGVALTAHGVQRHIWKEGEGARLDQTIVRAERNGDRTQYVIFLPLDAIGLPRPNDRRFALNILVNDNDGAQRTGQLEWTPGIANEKSPETFPVITLEP